VFLSNQPRDRPYLAAFNFSRAAGAPESLKDQSYILRICFDCNVFVVICCNPSLQEMYITALGLCKSLVRHEVYGVGVLIRPLTIIHKLTNMVDDPFSGAGFGRPAFKFPNGENVGV